MSTTEKKLRGFALDYPGATEHFPWGHRALKIRHKAFVFSEVLDRRGGDPGPVDRGPRVR